MIMDFKEALLIINEVIPETKGKNYDGIIVKKLEASNTLDEGRTTNQTHIAITGNQMDIFPYLSADGYFNRQYEQRDDALKKYFVAQIPIRIYKSNVVKLGEPVDDILFDSSGICNTASCVVRSRRKDAADQVQLSLTTNDDKSFVLFRKKVHAGSYLVLLKVKEKFLYDCFAVKQDAAYELSTLNNCFYKDLTKTPVNVEELLEKEKVDESVEDDSIDEYERAAKYLQNYASKNEIIITERSDVEIIREDFIKRYGPEKLASLEDDELLEKMFYSKGDNSDALCFWLEMNKECRKSFGSIAGGSAYKFGLFQKKDTGVWQTGSSLKPIDLSEEDALIRGKAIRDGLLKACKIIEDAKLETLDDYEKLDETLLKETSNEYFYYNWAWAHKYFSIIYPEKLSSYHNDDWQKHILRGLGIKPSEKFYGRSGQIAIVQRHANWIYRQFMDVALPKFGGVKQFLRLGSSDDERGYASEWKQKSIVGIGWPAVCSLEDYRDEDGWLDIDKIIAKLKEAYYKEESMSSTATRKAGELIRFFEASSDSIFVVMEGEKLIGLVDEVGSYSYDDSLNLSNIKSGKWHTPFEDGEQLPNKSEGKLTSCYQFKDDDNLLYLYKKYFYGDELEEEEDMENKLKNCLEVQREHRENAIYPLNQIIYGAPGTGKTYSTAEYAIAIIENREADLSKKTYDERKAVMKKYNDYIRKGQIVFTTFHQSYGYEEFIQGLRPDTKSEKMAFKTVDGVFKHIADVALNDPDNNYVIIIDEINRANISKVFGELITLIEEDKRWGELNETCATLQSGDVFAVPNNLYIIGTMNSADKSISLIDAALRRRFEFVEQKPEPELIDDSSLKGVLSKMNSKLADELDSSDLLIGHSYFMNKSEAALPSIMNNSIIPLLYEYFYDNKKKVASVLDYSLGDLNIEIVDDKMGRLSVKKKAD